MPYQSLDEAKIKELDGVPLTLEQVNAIAAQADAIDAQREMAGKGWAMAIASFKQGHEVKGDAWVKRDGVTQTDDETALAEVEKASKSYLEKLVGYVRSVAPGIIEKYHQSARGYAGGSAPGRSDVGWMEKAIIHGLSAEHLDDADDDDLVDLHKRLHELYDAGIAKSQPTRDMVHIPTLDMGRKPRRAVEARLCVKAHMLLAKELERRGLKVQCAGMKAAAVHKDEESPDDDENAYYSEIVKADKAEQKVWGVVLEPHTVDAQGDWETEEAIAKAAHRWAESYQGIGLRHVGKAVVGVHVVESYIAPCDFKLGDQDVKKGSWILGAHITDGDVWKDVESGKLNGWSVQGEGRRTKKAV